MYNVKQVTVIRKDLHMRQGKAIAQGQHAAMSFITKKLFQQFNERNFFEIALSDIEIAWLNESFAKICLYVNSEQELKDICSKAKEAGLECHEIIDNGTTEFHGIPTLTCCAIGPDESEKIDKITGHLKLL